MKIVKLTTENVKRISAVEIVPKGNVIAISGKNGAGKSSVLDSIAYALGGQTLVPDKPIRKGKEKARVQVDLGDMLVTRQFWLRPLSCDCEAGEGAHEPSCPILLPPTTQSKVSVETKEGAQYKSPQAVLDSLLGSLSFDPLAFTSTTPKEQAKTLRELVGIDVSELDKTREDAYDARRHSNREAARFIGILNALPLHEAPEEEIPFSEITAEIGDAEKKRVELAAARNQYNKLAQKLVGLEESRADKKTFIEHLNHQLDATAKFIGKIDEGIAILKDQLSEQKAKGLAIKVPDVGAIQNRLAEIEASNKKVRANKERETIAQEYSVAIASADQKTVEIEAIDKQKQKVLASAKFPIKGLAVDKDVVTFNAIPFQQASTAEQLKISVAIGLALNPTLRVLLIRDGNALDSDSLKVIAEMASEADAQLWLERVAETKEGMTILIEDGAIARAK